MSWVLVGVLGYVSVQLLIGVLVSRRIATEEDYLVAGRSLGPVLATFSVFATWFGAETCIGAAGEVYEHGLTGATHDPFAYALCIFLMGAVLAGALWRRKLITLADLHRQRYSPGVERLAVMLMAPTSLLWAAAQIRAFGQVLSASSDLGLHLTITLAAAVVVIYTMTGGLLADAITDVIQGVALMVGVFVLFGIVVNLHGGPSEALASIPPERLRFFELGDRSYMDIAETWLVPVVGSLVAQELVARVLASRSASVARGSAVTAAFVYLGVGMVPVALGLLGAVSLPGLSSGEQILPLLAREHLPTVLFVLFAGALVSAILSTVDSALLAVSAVVSHNLLLPLAGEVSERGKVRMARGVVLVAGLVAYALAVSSDSVFGLVEQASAFGGAGIAVVTFFGLFSAFGGVRAGYAGLGTGMVVQILGAYVFGIEHAFTWSLLLSLAAYITVGAFEQNAPPPAEAREGSRASAVGEDATASAPM